MNFDRTLRPWELSLLLALCLALFAGVWADAQQERLAGQLVRLHVIAASDSPADPAEKLAVRDAVLETLTPRLAKAKDAQAAQAIIRAARPALLRAARTATNQPLQIVLGSAHYPTRDCGTFALPAGNYTSLRLILGAGEGHNWWCVVFPPLVTPETPADGAVETLSREDLALLQRDGGEYEIRFRILELWDMLCERLEK